MEEGFKVPKDKPSSLDLLPVSVGTDSGLALQTRKGTSDYNVPPLKGLWYRGPYLHDGSAATLEEMFDPKRLEADHAPGGFRPLNKQTNAIPGHTFGLKLNPDERSHLIAFLKTLCRLLLQQSQDRHHSNRRQFEVQRVEVQQK